VGDRARCACAALRCTLAGSTCRCRGRRPTAHERALCAARSDNDKQIPEDFRVKIEGMLKSKPASGSTFYQGQVGAAPATQGCTLAAMSYATLRRLCLARACLGAGHGQGPCDPPCCQLPCFWRFFLGTKASAAAV
jgi:hypothetical protein